MSNNPPDSKSDANGAKANSQSDHTPLEKIIVDEHGKPYTHESKPYQEFKKGVKGVFDRIPHGERLSIMLTAIIALSTIGQLVVSCTNNSSTTKQVNNLIESSNRITEAADNFSRSSSSINTGVQNAVTKLGLQAQKVEEARASSVEQSNKSLDAAIAQSHLDQRAWVAVFEVAGTPVNGTPLVVTVKARNTGKTFAKRFRMTVIIGNGTPNFELLDGPSAELNASISVLSPGAEYNSVTNFSGPKSHPLRSNPDDIYFRQIAEGSVKPYVIGKLWYADIFGVNHWTTFCEYLAQNLSWTYCTDHNEVDNN